MRHTLAADQLCQGALLNAQAYLKSMKQPVGGKKADLEERVRVVLGGQVATAAVSEA